MADAGGCAPALEHGDAVSCKAEIVGKLHIAKL